jgi:hypothetical protein
MSEKKRITVIVDRELWLKLRVVALVDYLNIAEVVRRAMRREVVDVDLDDYYNPPDFSDPDFVAANEAEGLRRMSQDVDEGVEDVIEDEENLPF